VTYYVFSGTLNPAQSQSQSVCNNRPHLRSTAMRPKKRSEGDAKQKSVLSYYLAPSDGNRLLPRLEHGSRELPRKPITTVMDGDRRRFETWNAYIAEQEAAAALPNDSILVQYRPCRNLALMTT